MTAVDLSRQAHQVKRFDVIGEHSPSLYGFVKHVALSLVDDGIVRNNQNVDVVHMGPPLLRNNAIKAHVAGSIPLSNEEVSEVESWIAEIEDEYRDSEVGGLRQYCIHPPWTDESDPNTAVRRYRRYSCAGFVLDAHRQVRIELLKIDKGSLPEVDAQTIQLGYPRASSAHFPRFGLKGTGPWRIVLAGYVLHALNRQEPHIRQGAYRAQPGDERF